ncbi:hypothetical protein CCHL11_03472 [Colletotrichum chlorophyti]|uniref:Repetitive proline-rich cell wall protein n=1 Tax=Colletotrichum chlorophyti TaxID=708187 RepID=A0A1Q8S054_9PEZI|nr:hypothetical protein CCHL11_03472 [Colletotrichum chlorophyti]
MKFTTALLALAATAFATEDHDHDKGKDITKTIVTEVLTTYTTVCPVTVTKHGPGTTHYEVVTTTSTVIEKVPTKIIEVIPGPTKHLTKTDVHYTTYTKYIPITKTITGEGHTYVTTVTEVSKVVEKVPTKVWETVPGPTKVLTETDVEYTTYTKFIPITKTTTAEGQTHVVTETLTSTIVEKVHTKVYHTEKLPDVTKTQVDVHLTTLTTVIPHTKTVTQDGETIIKTFDETKTIVTKVPSKVWETVKLPDVTKTHHNEEVVTVTSVYPVTKTHVVDGETKVEVIEVTKTVVEKAQTTVDVYTTLLTTKHVYTDVYETIVKPETTYQTIEGESTYWVTKTATKQVHVTHLNTVTEVIPVTKTKEVHVTVPVTVGGEEVVTQHSWVYVTVSGTVYATETRAPSTVIVPTTSAVTIPATTAGTTVVASTAPVVVPTNAAEARRAPAAAILAGLFGAVAML